MTCASDAVPLRAKASGWRVEVKYCIALRAAEWEARTMQNTRPAGKFGTTADNLFMGDTVMDNRIDLQCCIILSPAGPPTHWYWRGDDTSVPVFSMHGVLCHHAAVTRAPLVCTTWCLVTGSSPLPILLLVSSHRSYYTDCTEVIAMVWATLDIELSAGVTNQDFSGISNRLSCCCWEGRGAAPNTNPNAGWVSTQITRVVWSLLALPPPFSGRESWKRGKFVADQTVNLHESRKPDNWGSSSRSRSCQRNFAKVLTIFR